MVSFIYTNFCRIIQDYKHLLTENRKQKTENHIICEVLPL
jgi:hypothetical protein